MNTRNFARADLTATVISAIGKTTQGRISLEEIRDDSFLWPTASDPNTRQPGIDLESIELVTLLSDLENELGIELIARFDDSVRTVDALVTLCHNSLSLRH